MNLAKLRTFLTKNNLLYTLLVVFCLLEAVQFLDYSQPWLPSPRVDPALNYRPILREDLLCAKAELQTHTSVHTYYFVNDPVLAGKDLSFEESYTAYLFEPQILEKMKADAQYAVTVTDPSRTAEFLQKYPYTLQMKCGTHGVLVLRLK